MNNSVKRFCVASAAVTAATLGLFTTSPAWAISGNVEITSKQSIYNKGDLAEFEIKIKTPDGADFLLQTNMTWSNGLTLQSVTGDNIQYNRGKIVGTAPQSEFIINVTMKVNLDEDQTITLTDTKLGAVDGSPNCTIAKTEKVIDIKETVVEPPVTEPPATTPPETEPPTTEPPVTEPPKQEETTPPPTEAPAYKAWKATVKVDDNLNIRQGPGLNYKIVGKYVTGDEVNVTDEEKNGDITWLKVEKGWISKDYVLEGHDLSADVLFPGKTDEEIEKEQQEQIKNEAQDAENKNQANNEAAQKKDEEKKEQYDKNEQVTANTTPPDATVESVPEEETPVDTEKAEDSILAVDSVLTTGSSPVTPLEDSSYARYQTASMQKPFYLYLESYSLTFPEDFEKTAIHLGTLDFLMAVPTEASSRKPNVYLLYGAHGPEDTPSLFYFDKDSDSFFPYEKMGEKTVIIDNTVKYEKKSFTMSHILIGLLGILGLYGLGAFTTALSYRKKEKNTPPPSVPQPRRSQPKPTSNTMSEVMSMDDAELDNLLKVYGASTEDMMKRETQKLGDLKNIPTAVRASSVLTTAEESPKSKKPPVDTNKGKEMQWDTLAKIMTNPEMIEEAPVEEAKASTIEEKLAEAEAELEDAPKTEINIPSVPPAAALDMEEIPDMYLQFEQAVKEDKLTPESTVTDKDEENAE